MERGQYLEALRLEIVGLVKNILTPLSNEFNYSSVALEEPIKWRPSVLVLGNYSSGKSTLINELIGTTIQQTGQAPTDDSFTVITYAEADGPIRVIEERDGKALLNDPEFPFAALRLHGQRFSAHFRLKRVNAPFLKHLAIIDTPGMLDSIAERDRGYDYQQVVGDFAQIADLILILFDPHKAGTVREAHASLRDTLPARTFEDRVRFVLNRVDECQQLSDLIRVYGTLCWNLSQMTGRKDIPKIHLTYASQASQPSDYLKYLDNERAQLVNVVRSAPELRLDHLVSYVELHAERLGHLVEALVTYTSRARRRLWRSLWLGFVISATFGFVATATAFWTAGVADPLLLAAIGCSTSLLVYFLWCLSAVPALQENFRSRQIVEVDELTDLSFQSRKDSWANVKAICAQQIKSKMLKRRVVRRQQKLIQEFISKKIPELRAALSEYHGLAKE